MRIFRHHGQFEEPGLGAVAAIGNFDGVHLGHQQVIRQAGAIADTFDAPLAVLTFEPHPRMLFQPDAPPFRITTSETRAAAIAPLNADILVEFAFDTAFSQLSAEDFVAVILRDQLELRHVVCGYDFVFGHRRRGTPDMLREIGGRFDLGVTCMTAVAEADGAVYSSSRVRQCLSEGDPAGAAVLLGRPWSFSAVVEEGDRRGRTIGFPTCNLRIVDLVQPAHGVYAILVRIGDEGDWRTGVANFGRRPTVNDRGALFEAHIFDFEGDLYGIRLEIRVIDFIRPEMKFGDLDALTRQIGADAAAARTLLGA